MMKISAVKGEALNAALVAFSSDLAKVVAVTLAIALGIAGGLAIDRLFSREDASEV